MAPFPLPWLFGRALGIIPHIEILHQVSHRNPHQSGRLPELRFEEVDGRGIGPLDESIGIGNQHRIVAFFDDFGIKGYFQQFVLDLRFELGVAGGDFPGLQDGAFIKAGAFRGFPQLRGHDVRENGQQLLALNGIGRNRMEDGGGNSHQARGRGGHHIRRPGRVADDSHFADDVSRRIQPQD